MTDETVTTVLRNLVTPQRLAEFLRLVPECLRSGNANPLVHNLMENFVEPVEAALPGHQWAKNMRRALLEHDGHVNALTDNNIGLMDRSPGVKLPRNISTLTERFVEVPIATIERTANYLLRQLDKIIQARTPHAECQASLDEYDISVYGSGTNIPANDPWHYMHFTVGNKDGSGRAHRWHVGIIQIPYCKLKYPVWVSLYTDHDKENATRQTRFPAKAEVVTEFLGQLKQLEARPRYVYMDRGFCSWATLEACWVYKQEQWENCRIAVDFVMPAVRWGAKDLQKDEEIEWQDVLRMKDRRKHLGRPTIAKLVDEAPRICKTSMDRHTSWKFVPLESGDEQAPDMPVGWNLAVVTAPRGEVTNDRMTIGHGYNRSFACWTTAKLTAHNAYDVIKGYTRRNYIESLFAQHNKHFGMTRSPDGRRRAASGVMSFLIMAVFSLFKLEHGNRIGDYAHEAYPLSRFLAGLKPAITRLQALELGGT